MIVHVLFLAIPAGLSASAQSEIDGSIERLREIPDLGEFTHGPDFSGRGQGFNHAAVMTFDDRAALAAYGSHPVHQQLVDLFQRLDINRSVIDYEVESKPISG